MSGVNALACLGQEPDKEPGVSEASIAPAAEENVHERNTLEVFERDVIVILVLANLVDDPNVRMLYASGGPGLFEK
jgi:hypothetical protein